MGWGHGEEIGRVCVGGQDGESWVGVKVGLVWVVVSEVLGDVRVWRWRW